MSINQAINQSINHLFVYLFIYVCVYHLSPIGSVFLESPVWHKLFQIIHRWYDCLTAKFKLRLNTICERVLRIFKRNLSLLSWWNFKGVLPSPTICIVSYNISICFWYQGNADLIEWIRKYSLPLSSGRGYREFL